MMFIRQKLLKQLYTDNVMDTVFFIVCKINFRLVLSKRWIRREYYFESCNCDVYSCYAKNVIRNPDCEAIL